MSRIEEKFNKLGIKNAPGQEVLQKEEELELMGEKIEGIVVDFSHGDIDAHPPIPGSLDKFIEGYNEGGRRAYTEYRGSQEIRGHLAEKISTYTNTTIDMDDNLIITPGTQGALFTAMGSVAAAGDKIAIMEPDYFANRKIAAFLECQLLPIGLDYFGVEEGKAGIKLEQLEKAFKAGATAFLFSNPNNPTGVLYSKEELEEIAKLATKYDVTVIADELYSRQIFDGRKYHHMINEDMGFDKLITIMGPSKTESMSGFRTGVAFGSKTIISRMEELQAIACLRTAGYTQSALKLWFDEPAGWLDKRIKVHQEIRDDLVERFSKVKGLQIRKTEGGSYIFPKLPELKVSQKDFVRILRTQANVIVTIGTEFGAQFTNSIRLNFSQDPDRAAEAVDRIIKMIEIYRA